MATLFNISDAASLGIHAMLLLAGGKSNGAPVSAKDLAGRIHASEAHLSKVMQRLAKAELVVSTRGPKGGFRLRQSPDEISVMDIYKAIEGPVSKETCLLDEPLCQGNCCLFGTFLSGFSEVLIDHMNSTKLSQLCPDL